MYLYGKLMTNKYVVSINKYYCTEQILLIFEYTTCPASVHFFKTPCIVNSSWLYDIEWLRRRNKWTWLKQNRNCTQNHEPLQIIHIPAWKKKLCTYANSIFFYRRLFPLNFNHLNLEYIDLCKTVKFNYLFFITTVINYL